MRATSVDHPGITAFIFSFARARVWPMAQTMALRSGIESLLPEAQAAAFAAFTQVVSQPLLLAVVVATLAAIYAERHRYICPGMSPPLAFRTLCAHHLLSQAR